jgi:hypothetical protein
MKNNNTFLRASSMLMVVSLLAVNSAAFGQESAYADLDACTKSEQIKATAKGAFAGALAGFGAAFLSGKKDDAVKAAAAGALLGGTAGFAVAFNSAYATCMKLNSSWIPESNIVRDPSKSFDNVNNENHYQPKDGIVVLAKSIEMPSSVKSGTDLDITNTFDLMTPDGAEAPISIKRTMFTVAADGTEKQLYIPVKSPESRTEAAGRSRDIVKLKTRDIPAGTTLRMEFNVAATGDKTGSTTSRLIRVE